MNKPRLNVRLIPHVLLAVYALILLYVIFGLIVGYAPSPDIFVDLSIALLFFGVAQSLYELGLRKTLVFLAVALAISFAMEILGTNTGLPFGRYHYTDLLGSEVLSVPIAVPLVWFVISYLALSITIPAFSGRYTVSRSKKIVIFVSLVGAFGTMSWDLLLDPMFTSYGYWIWDPQSYPIPEISGVPITNFVGWLFTTFIIVSTFLYLAYRMEEKIIFKRANTIDSRIVYVLLMADGIIANLSLNNALISVLGGLSMGIFVGVSFVFSRGVLITEKPSEVSRAQDYQNVNEP